MVFDEQRLAEQNLLEGTAAAGRGNTFFFKLNDTSLVLRHYRRGGLVQRISADRYVFTGIDNTRAMQEFNFLKHLQALQLPVSAPYACQVIRHGVFYCASLVTYRLSGTTLAQRLVNGGVSTVVWEAIGDVIARFHGQGIYHADLNAHNILLDQADNVFLIDFDRARCRALPTARLAAPTTGTVSRDSNKALGVGINNQPNTDPASGWCLANINRLKRSLQKSECNEDVSHGFARLQSSWETSLRRLGRESAGTIE